MNESKLLDITELCENQFCNKLKFNSKEKFRKAVRVLKANKEWFNANDNNLTLKVDNEGLMLISTEISLGIWISGGKNDGSK